MKAEVWYLSDEAEEAIAEFIKKIEDKGVQFGNYDISEEFERFVFKHYKLIDNIIIKLNNRERKLFFGLFEGNGVLIDVVTDSNERITDIYFFYTGPGDKEAWEELKTKLKKLEEEDEYYY